MSIKKLKETDIEKIFGRIDKENKFLLNWHLLEYKNRHHADKSSFQYQVSSKGNNVKIIEISQLRERDYNQNPPEIIPIKVKDNYGEAEIYSVLMFNKPKRGKEIDIRLDIGADHECLGLEKFARELVQDYARFPHDEFVPMSGGFIHTFNHNKKLEFWLWLNKSSTKRATGYVLQGILRDIYDDAMRAIKQKDEVIHYR